MIGQMVSHYRIIVELGSGSMGEVYLAEDERLHRQVALKILSPKWTADEWRLLRFQQEAQTISSLSHPNILTIFDIGQSASIHFIATEFVVGETLRHLQKDAPWDLPEAIEVALQIASGLVAAHQAGIVHCDIKPDNLMLRADGLLKILDFGIARLFERPEPLSVAATGTLALAENEITGTALYMSPEQVRGESLDARTDIFSLGVVLYEMLTGRRPFEGDNVAQVFRAILEEEPLALSHFRDDVPLELEALIRTMLEKNRDERLPSIEQLRAELQRLKSNLRFAPASETNDAIEHCADFQPIAASLPSSQVIDAGASEAVTVKVNRLQTFAWQYRKRLAAVGMSALLLMAFDLLVFQPQGNERSRDAALLLMGAICLTLTATARRKPTSGFQALPKGAAFRGLLPFQEADRKRFYGREMETLALFEMVAQREFRFGVLYGESGAGKTSLVKAALVPKLWEVGYAPIYCRSYKDPLATILEECRKRSRVAPEENESPISYLQRVAEEWNAGLVIICDQFEEFFVNFKSKEERQPFLAFVEACHQAEGLPLKLLFSMRSDFLYLIHAEFAGRIAEPLMTACLYHLHNFDERQAAEIIEKSAAYAQLPIEESLIRQLARDLLTDGSALPSELQIVGEQLQNKRIYTLQEYRRAGGKEPLVYSFLEDVMQSSGDGERAGLLLRSLISEENTRLTLPLAEIAKRMQCDADAVEPLLKLFIGSRLIREVQEDEPWRYELMHEYLIEKINQITGRVLDATQRANRLLRQYLSSYVVDKSARIPIGKLFFIRRYGDQAKGERARELMTKSLRRGMAQLSMLALIVATIATLAAATLSVSEEWESRRLSDGHTAAVRRVIFSPDGRRLVSCGEDSKVMVWDFARRKRLATFTDHTGIVTAVTFSPDGKWFATASTDKTVIVWDAARLEKMIVLAIDQGDGEPIVEFSSDGRFLVAAGGKAVSYRVGSFDKVAEFARTGSNFAFLPNSSKFTTDADLNIISVVDAATGKLEKHEITGLKSGVIAVSADGRMRMSIDPQGVVEFLDFKRYKVLKTVAAHKDNGRGVAFSPDSRLAASGSENVILWDVRTQAKIATLEHEALVWSVKFSPDGKYLVSSHTDGAILVWDVAERQRVANLNEHSGAIYTVAYSPDGRRIASAGEDSSIIIWDSASGQKESVLLGYQSRLNGLAFLPDGERLLSTGAFERPVLWDLRRGEALRTYPRLPKWNIGTNGFALSPDGRWLATSESIYEIADGRILVELMALRENDKPDDDWLGTGSQIYGLAFSKDARLLACATVHEGHIGLVDTASWEIVAHTQAPDSLFISLSFSPNGKYLATGEDNGKVELWSVNPLARLAVLGRHAARVKSVAFSPDGKQIASSSDDKTIALWNVGSRSLAARIGTHAAPVRAVAFSPDGKHLVSGEHDKSVRIHTRYRTLWGYRLD